MVIFCILFLLNISLFYAYDNPAALPKNFPFSYKINNTHSIIFMKDSIVLYNVNKVLENSEPLEEHFLGTDLCPSGEEKGGIYLNKYYYTSCLESQTSKNFQIKVYNEDFDLISTFPSNTNYYSFSTGSIRFFKKNTSPEMVGIAWLNNGEFNLLKTNHTRVKKYWYYPVNHMARDIDCLFISNLSRIVCLFGIEINDEYTCSVNIFTYDDNDDDSFTSNLKTWYVCTNHLSRKIRGNMDNDPNSRIFFYYFVDTNKEAFIIQMELVNEVTINIGPVIKVMSGCHDNQNSFDMAEDKLMGYYVFICVESRFKKRIKIQLFKIENNNIIF